MALNLDLMRDKLNSLNGKGDKKDFWRPQDGENNIRILGTLDDKVKPLTGIMGLLGWPPTIPQLENARWPLKWSVGLLGRADDS